MAQRIFVGGLSFNTSEDALNRFFAQAGTVQSAAIVTDRDTGRSRGFGFVEMASIEEARQAVSQLNGRDLDGRQLKVELAKPKTDDRRDSGRGSYAGGGRGGWR